MVKSELDLWYEMWDRAGSQGLDTWYELRGRMKVEEESAEGLGGVGDVQPRPVDSWCDGEASGW